MIKLLDNIGGRVLDALEHLGHFFNIAVQSAKWIWHDGKTIVLRPVANFLKVLDKKQSKNRKEAADGEETFVHKLLERKCFKVKPFKSHNLFVQMLRLGVGSAPIVVLINYFIGMILAMQSSYSLKQMGGEAFVADLVALAVLRELAPLITAVILAGRVGAAIAAEIGTMKVSEEIDAIRTIGLNPVHYIIVPRVLGFLLMLPCLTIIADFVGILGGYVIGVGTLGISSGQYIQRTVDALVMSDFVTGLIKSVAFALVISLVGCYQGYIVKGGAEGVGKSTTNSVVIAIILTVAVDVFFTALFSFVIK